MNSSEIPNSVSGTVLEVESFFPEGSPCEDIEMASSHFNILWPFGLFDVQIAQKYPCEWVFFLCSRSTKMEGPCHISCSIQVLSSWINQVDHVFCDDWAVSLCRMIMNDGSIGTSATDRDETKSSIILLLFTQVIKISCSFKFSNLVLFRSPSPEFSHSNTISNMASSETIDFLISSLNSVKSDTFPFNGGFYLTMNWIIQLTGKT